MLQSAGGDTGRPSFLGDGAVSWLYYADRLMEFPLGIFSIAVGTVILPALSVHHATRSVDAFSHTLDWGLRTILVIGLPAAVGLVLFSGPLVTTLFGYGAFDARERAYHLYRRRGERASAARISAAVHGRRSRTSVASNSRVSRPSPRRHTSMCATSDAPGSVRLNA